MNLLALAGDRCNAYKGPNLTSIDPDSGQVVALFNPRTGTWTDHFALRGGDVIGLTPIGRATVRLLNMNALRRVQLREEWIDEGGRIQWEFGDGLFRRGEPRFASDGLTAR